MMSKITQRPARLGKFIKWLHSFDPRPRPSKGARKLTHHRERREATREIREAICQ